MPLVNSRQMLLDARRGGYAVAAFNVENMEMAQAVLEAAHTAGSPVMLQTTPSTLRYADANVFFAMIHAIASSSPVEAALHLDHGNGLELVRRALDAGYNSVMIDGSALPFQENIDLTRAAVSIAGDIPVEGELGRVGGKEDDLQAEADPQTDPEQAALFAAETGVSSLAVGIGTAHGFYASTPALNLDCLSAIRAVVDIPLVLHGASGLTDEAIKACIARGICKVNFATELRVAYTAGIKQALRDSPGIYDPKVLGEAGKQIVRDLATAKIKVCSG